MNLPPATSMSATNPSLSAVIQSRAVQTMNAIPSACRWLRLARPVSLAMLALAFAGSEVLAQSGANPPERMTYQGYLVDGNGAALGSASTGPRNYDVIFRIYNHESLSGVQNLLWAEQQTITVDKGYFSVLLGEGAASEGPRPNLSALFTGPTASDRFVQVTVKGIGANGSNVDILPRLRLLSSPYAFLAGQAVKLVRTDNGGDLLTSSGNAVSVGGPLSASSFTGIGSGLTQINANNISQGTIASDRIPGLDASKISSGTLSDARLSFNIARRDTANTFAGTQTVSGNLWVGENGVGGLTGYGPALVFSGAPNSENTDPIWLARYNNGINNTELRINIGDDAPTATLDRLVVGATVGGTFNQTGTWTPLLAVSAAGELELRPGLAGKNGDAGKIAYQRWSDALDIVGAGTSGNNRKIQFYAEGGASFNGSVNVASAVNANSFTAASRSSLYSWGLRTVLNGSQYADIYRDSGGLSLDVSGSMRNGTGGSTFRWAYYDGDSNWDFGSDRRLKKDIVDVEPMLERALKIQIRRYRWNDEDAEAKHKLGVIAQEVQELFPDMVGEYTNRQDQQKYLTVGYSDFGMVAVKALQEFKVKHDAEMKAVQNEMKSVKDEVADLKAQMREVLQANADLRARLDRVKSTASVER
jgi:hypothetical protein